MLIETNPLLRCLDRGFFFDQCFHVLALVTPRVVGRFNCNSWKFIFSSNQVQFSSPSQHVNGATFRHETQPRLA